MSWTETIKIKGAIDDLFYSTKGTVLQVKPYIGSAILLDGGKRLYITVNQNVFETIIFQLEDDKGNYYRKQFKLEKYKHGPYDGSYIIELKGLKPENFQVKDCAKHGSIRAFLKAKDKNTFECKDYLPIFNNEFLSIGFQRFINFGVKDFNGHDCPIEKIEDVTTGNFVYYPSNERPLLYYELDDMPYSTFKIKVFDRPAFFVNSAALKDYFRLTHYNAHKFTLDVSGNKILDYETINKKEVLYL